MPRLPPPSNPDPIPDALSSLDSSSSPLPKKKHVCPTCDRGFTTSGHLARHTRIHTGERNHKCPFPGCETRCSRQDNLQQHYRIHLSPNSRRSSSSATRQAIARALTTDTHSSLPPQSSARRSIPPPSISNLVAHSPPSDTPSLDPARLHSTSPPPDSPPALTQVTLPAAAHPPPESVSSRSSSSPESHYPTLIHSHLLPSPVDISVQSTSTQLHYRTGATTYQEQSQAPFAYVHASPAPHHTTAVVPSHGLDGTSFVYSNNYDASTLAHMHTPSPHQHSPSPSASSHRHSISHISHPHSYSQSNNHTPSPSTNTQSLSSHTSNHDSGYSLYSDAIESGSYDSNNVLSQTESSGLSAAYHSSHNSLVQGGYTSSGSVMSNHSVIPSHRFPSPPPVLAPIQDGRLRSDMRPSLVHHHSSPGSLLHPQPTTNHHYYQSNVGIGSGVWKSDYNVRDRGALVQ